jgi:hypothetical protein
VKTLETQENNVSFNQVSKLTQALKKTLHYKGLRGVTKSAIKTPLSCLSTVFFMLYEDIILKNNALNFDYVNLNDFGYTFYSL